jgi:tRNA threonylcarbamoyladenosine modification (KEOPS) complex  Pcc1 subunit
MDPLSITLAVCQLLQSVWTVSTAIYGFVQGTFEVDEALQSFLDEIESITRTSETIQKFLDSPTFKSQHVTEDGSLEDLMRPLQGSMKSCEKTLVQFENVLRTATGSSQKRNLYHKTKSNISLNINAQDIITYRAQIATHVSTMQLALQIITL